MNEYEAHVKDKKCPAGECKNLMEYVINPENCVGCTACARGLPRKRNIGQRKEVHHIDQTICIKCGACRKNVS